MVWEMKLVPDTSVIIEGRLNSLLEGEEYRGCEVIIPEAVVAELEHQANRGRESGFNGLEELRSLTERSKQGLIELTFAGLRPTMDQIKLAGSGEMDALIRQTAQDTGARFVTSDRVQFMAAAAKGMEVIYLTPEKAQLKSLSIEEFFTPDTMSVHLKEGVKPMAKKGSIKDIRLVEIRNTPAEDGELRAMVRELLERAKRDPNSFVEMEHKGATVLQIGSMRIAIAMPPFSDGIEITAVRPVAYVSLEDYRLSDELKQRLAGSLRGLLIAGPPGAGKSTFAAGVAEFLQNCNKIVKTMESPRDLMVDAAITQYAPLEGSMEKTADLLLLVRPDYTIYDEVRKTRDFQIFADMRLAGVGMVGVVHANRPVDAIQRLIGRVELGMIPQVVDTVIFIDRGEVAGVYDIKFTVKVPQGMTESDLARPVITISDFETKKVEYEIYSYGEQVVVMPTTERTISSAWNLAAKKIREEFRSIVRGPVSVELSSDDNAVVHLNEDDIPAVLGKGGRNIDKMEQKLGIHIDVRPMTGASYRSMESIKPPEIKEIIPEISMTERHILLRVEDFKGKEMEVWIEDEYIFNGTIGRKGDIRITRDSDNGEKLQRAVKENLKIHLQPASTF